MASGPPAFAALGNAGHAPSVPGGEEARRCDGYAGASRQPGAGCPPAPGDPGGPPREPLRGSPGPCGSPGLPCGARVAAICVPVRCFGFPLRSSCPERSDHTLSHSRRSARSAPLLAPRPQRSRPGLLDLEPSRLSFRAPAAATMTVNGSIHVPSQATARAGCHTRQAAGISGAARTCAHGESHHPSFPQARAHRRRVSAATALGAVPGRLFRAYPDATGHHKSLGYGLRPTACARE